MWLKIAFLFTYLSINVGLFVTFDIELSVWLSFFCSALILAGIVLFHIFEEKEYSPFLSAFVVFNFLFFIVAPIVQINNLEGENPQFVTNFPYHQNLVIYVNLLICVFNVIFFCAYLFFKKKFKPLYKTALDVRSAKLLPITLITILALSCLIFLVSLDFIFDEIQNPSWLGTNLSVMQLLIYKKVLFLIPFGGVVLCIQYFKISKKKAVNIITIGFVLFCFLGLLLWFKNPLTEKRNALGPIYICLIFLFIPRLLNSNIKMLSFLFFSMVLLFPLTAFITHTDATFNEILKDPSILIEQAKGGGVKDAFNTINYDAFANFTTTIEFVNNEGYAHGHQAAGALLFFVPRSIWTSKPVGTGEYIGEYLVSEYDFSYTNLANPFISEGYINFGIMGVILFAAVLGFFFSIFLRWIKSDNYLYKILGLYFAIHLLFLLRGDFTNGYSYYVGTLIGALLIPKGVMYVIDQSIKYQNKWKLQQKA